MLNPKKMNKTETKLIVGAATSGLPVIQGGACMGVAMTDKPASPFATIVLAPTPAFTGAGSGFWPIDSYVLYGITALDADGKESLPRFILVGPVTGADDTIELSIPNLAGAVSHNIYRGVSNLVPGDVGTDLIFIANVAQGVGATAFSDNGYEHTQYAAPVAPALGHFEEVAPKGSSQRPPSSRDSELRIAEGTLLSLLTDGVVELPVDPAILHTLAEGTAVDWDAVTSMVVASGAAVALGVNTFAYHALSPATICVKIDL